MKKCEIMIWNCNFNDQNRIMLNGCLKYIYDDIIAKTRRSLFIILVYDSWQHLTANGQYLNRPFNTEMGRVSQNFTIEGGICMLKLSGTTFLSFEIIIWLNFTGYPTSSQIVTRYRCTKTETIDMQWSMANGWCTIL